ncbi:AGAP001121-PA-like protein [Anopheles sinensis]|uniref:AGAP001121-PA-like protein n=1 Tax=Anopheles sinensis TaxID=74873 RepID=A0A084W081_ANOSI|nr:AGAP001121-PA-like protein [Anopheles sinensis]
MVVATIHAAIPYDIMNNGSLIVTYGIRALLVGGAFGISAVTILMKHPMDLAEQKATVLKGTFCAVVIHFVVVIGYNSVVVLASYLVILLQFDAAMKMK